MGELQERRARPSKAPREAEHLRDSVLLGRRPPLRRGRTMVEAGAERLRLARAAEPVLAEVELVGRLASTTLAMFRQRTSTMMLPSRLDTRSRRRTPPVKEKSF